jgi:hypothetical protein
MEHTVFSFPRCFTVFSIISTRYATKSNAAAATAAFSFVVISAKSFGFQLSTKHRELQTSRNTFTAPLCCC